MPPEAAPFIVTLEPLLMLVAEIVELFASAALVETLSVNDLAFTVPALSLTLICTVYVPVEAGVQV